jgi:serine/threonine-protein kinase RsbW
MSINIKIKSIPSNIRIVEKAIDEAAADIGISKENYGKILVSTLEAVNNAIIHGNNSIPDKIVEVDIRFKNNELRIKVIDEGLGFNPGDVPDPTVPGNIESLNGRGVFLMSRLADKIKYSKKANTVTMIFKNLAP